MDNLSVKNFTNIDTEDFEGMYGGSQIVLRRGQTKAYPEKIAKHLAGQLVWKILNRKGKDYLLDPEREVLLSQILGDVVAPAEEPIEPPKEEVKQPEKEEEFTELEEKKPKKKAKK